MAGHGSPILGVDINPVEICVVEMQGIWPNVQVHRADTVQTPPGAMEGGRITDTDAVADALRGLLNRMHVSTRDAVMGISTQSVLTRTLDIPRVPDNEVRAILIGELAHYQILRENSETFDYIRLEPPHANKEANPQVLVMAADEMVVYGYCQVAERAGLHLVALEPILPAMLRAAYPQMEQKRDAVCLAISHGDIEIAIVEQGQLRLYRRLDISSNDLLRIKSGIPSLSEPETASPLLRPLWSEPEPEPTSLDLAAGPATPFAAMPTEGISQIDPAAANNLVIELRRSLDYYQSEYASENGINHLIVVTNHPELGRFAEWLAGAISIPTSPAEPPLSGEAALTIASQAEGPGVQRYIGAIGLGMYTMASVPAQVPSFNLSVQQRYMAGVAVVRRKMGLSLVCAIAGVLLLTLTGYRIGLTANRADHELYHLQEDLEGLSHVKQQRIDDVEMRTALLSTLKKDGFAFPRIMDALAQSVDPQAGLLEVNLTPTGLVTVSGEAGNEKVIIRTLEGLKRCPFFQNTSLDSFDGSAAATNQPRLIRFQITSQLAGVQPPQTVASAK